MAWDDLKLAKREYDARRHAVHPPMIADVVFDVPVPHPFSYRCPRWTTHARASACARRCTAGRGSVSSSRCAKVAEAGLKTLTSRSSTRRRSSPSAQLELARWIAAQSLSTLGSTCAALLPPPGGDECGTGPRARQLPGREAIDRSCSSATDASGGCSSGSPRLRGPSLVLVPDLDAAARWATRLGKLGAVVRLDSGADDAERAAAWRALGGRPRATRRRDALGAPRAARGRGRCSR